MNVILAQRSSAFCVIGSWLSAMTTLPSSPLNLLQTSAIGGDIIERSSRGIVCEIRECACSKLSKSFQPLDDTFVFLKGRSVRLHSRFTMCAERSFVAWFMTEEKQGYIVRCGMRATVATSR